MARARRGWSGAVVAAAAEERVGSQFSNVDELMEVNARLLSGGVVDDNAQEKVEWLDQ